MALFKCENRIDPQGKELLEHGTRLFPIACYHDDLMKEHVEWHWHAEIELILVSEGTALIAAGCEKFTVKQGEGFFINAGVLHAAWSQNPSVCRFHSIVFHPRLLGGSIDSIYWQKYVHPLLSDSMLKYLYFDGSESWHNEANDIIENSWKLCAAEPFGYELQVRSCLSNLLLLLSSYHPVTTKLPSERELRNNQRIKIMLLFIQEHYTQQINIAMIAKSAMISDSECLRCFRDTIGTSPIQYLKQFRIQKASELLLGTYDKIADISDQCGFQDTSYFVKTFREIMKCTPAVYRHEHS